MSGRASWWAKKLNHENAPKTPQQPAGYPQTPVAQPYAPTQPQRYQQQPQGDPNQRLSKEDFEQVLASGNPDAMGGAKTRSLQNRPGCPECGSPNYTPHRGTTTDHCYECGYTSRFGSRSA